VSAPDLCFVSAPGGSAFMEELVEVVADAVRRAGGRARTVVGCYPEPADDTVYVVVPHEYFVVLPTALHPGRELRGRTIGLVVEHPGTRTFERVAGLLPELGGAVDINNDSLAELTRRGVAVRHFQLGYSPLLDQWGGDPDSPRPLDVTYLGTAERRRSRVLGGWWRDLDHLRCRLLTPPHEPMTRQRVDFLPGTDKLRLLAGAQLLLNLHRENSTAAEWVRMLEAMCNGCVVVSEPCTDLAPLVPGRHLVVARPGALGAVAAALVADEPRLRRLRLDAYAFVRETLDMVPSAAALVDQASALVERRVRWSRPRYRSITPPTAAEAPRAVDTPPWEPAVRHAGAPTDPSTVAPDPDGPVGDVVAATLVARAGGTEWFTPPRSVDPDGPVDVLIVRRPGEPDPDELVGDLLRATVAPRAVLVCDDGGCPTRRHPPYPLLVHEFPMGRAHARNALLAAAGAPYVLVLDAGFRASPHLVQRLLAAVTDADVAHCPVADPVDGLVGALPAEAERLRLLPYLGSGYLVRRALLDELGGWVDDPLAEGLADHVFWRRVTGLGRGTALVQQVLLSREHPAGSGRPVDLDPTAVGAAVDLLATPVLAGIAP
jgi:hypothetical protein